MLCISNGIVRDNIPEEILHWQVITVYHKEAYVKEMYTKVLQK